MNLPCEAQEEAANGAARGTQRHVPAAAANGNAMATFHHPEKIVAPFEFQSLAGEDLEAIRSRSRSNGGRHAGVRGSREGAGNHTQREAGRDGDAGSVPDPMDRDGGIRSAIERARQEGFEAGRQEGRSLARSELEAEMHALVARERERLAGAMKEFGGARERYFAGVEQEVVKLALGIAERVLHREAQIDPLLLAGVVHVALEQMADRSGVVLRVAQADVEAWEQVFLATEQSERPRVVEDARLERGDCVLETKMGTVELGVSVQLKEVEKGFFDLLKHRPVQ